MTKSSKLSRKSTHKPASKSATQKANKQELARIEDLLGEDFESLTQARKALKDDIANIPKSRKLSAKEASKRSYTIRELDPQQRKQVLDFLQDKQTADSLDKQLLKEGDVWGATIDYNYTTTRATNARGTAHTYATYDKAQFLFRDLSRYITHAIPKSTRYSLKKFTDDIRIIRFNTPEKTQAASNKVWRTAKIAEVEERKERLKTLKKFIRDLKNEPAKRKKESAKSKERIHQLTEQVKYLEKALKKAKGRTK